MVQITYSDSIYRFTDPIRFFKANDPYYFEVDNIPLKQLEQNDKWLKDQITNLKVSNITRTDIQELRPYVTGSDRKVRVNPGRFIARINDAHSITPLQRVTQVLGANAGEFNSWEAAALNNILISDLLEDFKTELQTIGQNECSVPTNSQAFGVNGLIERAMTYPMKNNEVQASILIGTTKGLTGDMTVSRPPYPISEAQLWKGDTNQTTFIVKQYDALSPTIGFASLGVAEAVFVKRWRGVARTAVVDVQEPLEIDIPDFDPAEFFYTDQNGNVQQLTTAKQRIDLIFIYSKPIDAAETTIAKYNADGTATKITKPQLGIVKGAGLGLDFRKSVNNTLNTNYPSINAIDTNGISKILPHVLDQGNDLLGFSGIHGSFPSPEDLMNLTPMLLESLTDEHYALIGQSVLPIAYVVCKKDDALITEDDLIDIRPFFRTAELSYNERAGIAAALPGPSLANPFVTEAYIDLENKKILEEVDRKIANIQIPQPTGTGPTTPTNPTGPAGGVVVYSSYIKGGLKFGVEGALITKYASMFGNENTTVESIRDDARNYYELPEGYEFPTLPDWDLAEWILKDEGDTATDDKGLYPLDRVNYTFGLPAPNMSSKLFGPFAGRINASGSLLPSVGGDITYNLGLPGEARYFIKKTIKIDKTAVPWMRGYDVDVQFFKCFPIDQGSVWVDKKDDEFTIFISVSKPKFNFAKRESSGRVLDYGQGPGAGRGGYSRQNVNWQFNRGYNREGGEVITWRVSETYQERGSGGGTRTRYRTVTLDTRLKGTFCVLTTDMLAETKKQTARIPDVLSQSTIRNQYDANTEGETPSFMAMYPTVTFRVIGYPNSTYNLNLNSTNPVITLNG